MDTDYRSVEGKVVHKTTVSSFHDMAGVIRTWTNHRHHGSPLADEGKLKKPRLLLLNRRQSTMETMGKTWPFESAAIVPRTPEACVTTWSSTYTVNDDRSWPHTLDHPVARQQRNFHLWVLLHLCLVPFQLPILSR